jgi:hypothetical protein
MPATKSPAKLSASAEEANLFYQSARSELIQRLALRDQSLIAYIASAGAYFGFVVQGSYKNTNAGSDVLSEAAIVVVLPIISLVFTYVILQHHVMIGKLGEYTRLLFPSGYNHWDHTYASWEDKRYLSARTISQALLLILPLGYTAIFAMSTLPRVLRDPPVLLVVGTVLLFDVAVFFMIVRLQVWAYELRRQTDYTQLSTIPTS